MARSFGDDVWRLTAIEIAFSIGMMSGGAIIAAWGGFYNRVHTMTFASILMGVCTFALELVLFFGFICFYGCIWIDMPIFNTPTMVLVQEKVESNYLVGYLVCLG